MHIDKKDLFLQTLNKFRIFVVVKPKFRYCLFVSLSNLFLNIKKRDVFNY